MRIRAFLVLSLVFGSVLFSGEDPEDWRHHYHQKMYDYINEQLDQAEYMLREAKGLTTMTGNWNGARLFLEQHGVTITSSFVTDMAGNPIGGKAQGFAYAGSFGVALGIDFERAAGWKGFSFYSSAVWRTGTNLSARKINNQFPVQQVFGSQTVKLNELYFQKAIWNNLFTAKAGRLDLGNDFLASPLYAEFMNNGFNGNPYAIFNNFPAITAYPNATWGALLVIRPIDQLALKFAAYNANTYINQNKYHGVNFTFKSTNGVIWITEWVALINQNLGDAGLPGNYKVGFFYQTGNVQKFTDGIVHGDPCLYFLFDQMVYRPNGPGTSEGLTPFISLLFTPKSKNLFPFYCNGGVVYKGLIPGRPRDTTNLGFIYGSFSSTQEALQQAAKNSGLIGPFGNQPQSYEAILELNHWVQVNDWFTFTPDAQYIFNPKGYGTIQNAFVLGAQIGFVL